MRIYIACLLSVCVFACTKKDENISPKSATTPLAPVQYQSPLMKVPPEKMREAFLSTYRLSPDRRFLLAIGEIEQLLSGTNSGQTADATFASGKWQIRYAGSTLGELPEIPSFSDFRTVLSQRVKKAKNFDIVKEPASDVVGSKFSAIDMLSLISQANKKWSTGDRSRQSLQTALKALVNLYLQGMDRLEIGDIVAARTIALLTLAKEEGMDVTEEEGLISYLMGYSKHAAGVAQSMPPSSPVRLFLTQENESLRKAALQPSADARTKYLLILTAVKAGDVNSWYASVKAVYGQASPPYAVWKTGAEIKQPKQMEVKDTSQYASYVASSVLAEVLQQSGGHGLPGRSSAVSPATAKEFEHALGIVGNKYGGPLISPEVITAYYRSYFFAAQSYTAKIETGDDGEFGKQMMAYSSLLQETPTITDVSNTLQSLKIPGGGAFLPVLDDAMAKLSWDVPQIRMLLSLIVPHLDSRTGHREFLADMLYKKMGELHISENYYASLIRDVTTANGEAIAHAAYYLGDQNLMAELLESPACNAQCGASLLWDIYSAIGASSELEPAYDTLVARFPEDWSPTNCFIDFLRKKHDYKKACSVTDRWLERNQDPDHIGWYHAHLRQAHNYWLAGEYKKGINTLEPIAGSGFAVREEALLLNGLGKKTEAEEKAKYATEENKNDLESRLTYAVILWTNDKYEEAAQVLQSVPISTSDWCSRVAPYFVAAFSKKTERETEVALLKLQQQHVSKQNLVCFAREFATDGKYDRAFQASQKIQPAGVADMDVAIEAYGYLKKWQGESEAEKWINTVIPSANMNPLSVKAFYTGNYNLLWNAIRTPEKGSHPEWVWLFRAGASAMTGASDSHRPELLRHYAEDRPDWSHQTGRVLLGLSDPMKLLPYATNQEGRCDMAAWYGVNAHGQRRYEEASDWYQVALQIGPPRSGTRNMALWILARWFDMGQGLWHVKKARL